MYKQMVETIHFFAKNLMTFINSFGLVSLFDGIIAFVGYLMVKSSLQNGSDYTSV